MMPEHAPMGCEAGWCGIALARAPRAQDALKSVDMYKGFVRGRGLCIRGVRGAGHSMAEAAHYRSPPSRDSVGRPPVFNLPEGDSAAGRALAWRGTADYQRSWLSDEWLAFTGLRLEQGIGTQWESAVHPDHRQVCREAFRRACASQAPFQVHYPLRHRSGEYRWVLDVAAPLLSDSESFSGYLGYTFDLSVWERAEKRANDLSRRYQSILESMSDGVFGIDREGKTIFINSAVTAILGWSEEDVLGKNMHDLIHHSHADRTAYAQHACPVFLTMQDGQTRAVDTELFWRKDRSPVRVAYLCTALRDEQGIVTGATVTLRDITEKVRAREAFDALREQQRMILDTVPAMILYVDSTQQIVRANHAAAALVGCGVQELEGLTLDDVFARPAGEGERGGSGRRALGEEHDKQRWHCVDRTGIERWVEVESVAYRGPDGQSNGHVLLGRELTLEKRMEQALLISERQFHAAFETMTVGFAEADLQGRYLRVNQQFCRMTGYSEHELLSMGYLDLTHPEDRGQNLEKIQEVMDGRAEWFRLEKRYLRKDGTEWWADLTVTVVRDPTGQPLWTMAVHYDVSERKQIEESLRLSEERWQFALTASNEGVWDWNVEAGQIYLSPRYSEILGYQVGEVEATYDRWVQAIVPEDRDRVLANFAQHMEGKTECFVGEYRVRHKDGHEIWVLDRGKVMVRSASGTPRRMVGTFTDITARKRLEAAFVESQQRWQFALEGSRDGVWDWNPVTGAAFFSSRWKAILGYEDAEVQNTYGAWKALVNPEHIQEVERTLSEYMAGQRPHYEVEFQMRAKGGAYRWILARGKIMERLPDGRPVRVVGTHTDITERRQMEESLRLSEQRWQFALEGSESGVWDWRRDTDEVFFSPRWGQMLGYGLEERGMSVAEWSTRVHPDDFVRATTAMEQYLRGETQQYVAEIRVKTHDGSYRWILDRGKIMTWSPDGTPLRLLGTHTDITFLKQLQESLVESQELFASAFMHAPIGKALLGIDGRWLKVNPALCRILEYSEEELLQLKFQDLTYPDDLTRDVELILELLAGRRQSYEIEKRYITKSGTSVWVQRNVSCVRGADGQPAYFVSQVQDISARKEAEERLRKSERQFSAFMNNLQGAAWIKSQTGAYVYANQRWARLATALTGKDESIVGKTDAQVFGVKTGRAKAKLDHQVLKSWQPSQKIERQQAKELSETHLVTRFPIVVEGSGEVQLGGIGIDISKRIKTQEALEKSRARLRVLLDRQEQMACDLHDNSIQMLYAVGMDLYDCELHLREESGIDKCHEILARLVGRVNDVIKGLRQHLVQRGLPVIKMPGEVQEEIEAMVAQANSSGKTQVTGNISPAAIKQLDYREAAQVSAIVREALSNVLRHANANHAHVVLQRVPKGVFLEIADDGKGRKISLEGTDSSKRGLRNMRMRAKKLGADFGIENVKPSGTTIWMVIPKE